MDTQSSLRVGIVGCGNQGNALAKRSAEPPRSVWSPVPTQTG